MTVAVVAHAIWRSAGQAYAHPWPARFFDTIQPRAATSPPSGARWVDWLFTSRSLPGMMDTAWEAMGERLLTLLAAVPCRHKRAFGRQPGCFRVEFSHWSHAETPRSTTMADRYTLDRLYDYQD